MLQLDIDALTARFWDTPLTYTDGNGQAVVLPEGQILVQNQTAQDVDETKPWVRFVVSPGESEQVTTGVGKGWLQVGTAILQVCAPAGTQTYTAGQIRDSFMASFRNWRSPDDKLHVDGFGVDTFDVKDKSGEHSHTQINVTVMWESLRVY